MLIVKKAMDNAGISQEQVENLMTCPELLEEKKEIVRTIITFRRVGKQYEIYFSMDGHRFISPHKSAIVSDYKLIAVIEKSQFQEYINTLSNSDNDIHVMEEEG